MHSRLRGTLATGFAGTAAALVALLVPGTAHAAPAKLSHASAVSQLNATGGIGLSSSGGCSNRNNATCTSLEQVNAATISDVRTLRNASHCALTITGGTEVGHASGTYSHWNGYKIDFSPTSCVSNYVTGSFTRIADRGDGAARYRSAAGNVYAREGNHWDVTFCGGSAACTSAASS
ncbi:hypothetical protein ABT224_25730 [Streptomyces sp. NPDC001584]|uniref:hypothetical protein n=1 Tax=Streptomyces sp. NPDC001584 TaxID=3154521 RepID=UPI00332FB7B5